MENRDRGFWIVASFVIAAGLFSLLGYAIAVRGWSWFAGVLVALFLLLVLPATILLVLGRRHGRNYL